MIRCILAIMGINLAGIVALAFHYPASTPFPGALIPAHASLAKNCVACHLPLQRTVEARCRTYNGVSDIGVLTVAEAPIARGEPMPASLQRPADTSCRPAGH